LKKLNIKNTSNRQAPPFNPAIMDTASFSSESFNGRDDRPASVLRDEIQGCRREMNTLYHTRDLWQASVNYVYHELEDTIKELEVELLYRYGGEKREGEAYEHMFPEGTPERIKQLKMWETRGRYYDLLVKGDSLADDWNSRCEELEGGIEQMQEEFKSFLTVA
jgi:hypothetical protein